MFLGLYNLIKTYLVVLAIKTRLGSNEMQFALLKNVDNKMPINKEIRAIGQKRTVEILREYHEKIVLETLTLTRDMGGKRSESK